MHVNSRRIYAFERQIWAKMRDEEKASWIDTDLSNVENALKEIAEKLAVVEETAQNDKKKEHSAKAAEMRSWEL